MADKSLIGVNVCPECGKSFETPQGVGSHRARAHGYRRDTVETITLAANTGLQRPLDEEKVVAFMEDFPVFSFEDKVEELLPLLAYEAAKRLDQGETSLAQAFLILYLDAH